MKTFGRVLTAMITSFNEDGSVNIDNTLTIAHHLLENGSNGLVVCGTTGENPTISREEKAALFKAVAKECSHKGTIIANVGSNDTKASVDFVKEVSEIPGINGFLVVVPYYNKPNQQGQYLHFKAIAETSSLPIVLYNVPGRTGVNMKAETTVRIANDFPNIVAIKEAAGSLEQVDEIIKNKPKHFEVISGDDALTFPMIASGAVGVISVIGNALPKEFSRMIRLEFNGEYDAARIIHHQFTELYKLLFVDGNPAGCKALLNDMGMIENVLRLPLVPTRIETKQKMNDILKKMRLN